MKVPLRVLIVEGSKKNFASIVQALRCAGYDPTPEQVRTPQALRTALVRQTWDIVIAADDTRRLDGLTSWRVVQESRPDLPMIILAPGADDGRASQVIKAGVHDYVPRDDLTRLGWAVRRELRHSRACQTCQEAEEKPLLTQFAIDRASVGAFWIQSDGRIIYVNNAACQSLGYSRPELLSMTVHQIDPNYPAEAWPDHWRELREQGSLTFESRHRAKDGRVFPVEITANYVEFGGKEYNCAFARDITERRQAEEALYASLEQAAHERSLLLVLSEAAQTIQRARTADEVYRTIGEQVTRLGYSTVVFTLTKDQNHLEVAHSTFDPAVSQAGGRLPSLSTKNYAFPIRPDGIHAQILSAEQAMFFPRPDQAVVAAPSRLSHPLAGHIAALPDLGQSICAPLTTGSQTVGMLIIAGSNLTENDTPAVTAFANQAAIALENIRLYADLQQQMEQLRNAQSQLIQSAKLAAVGELAAGVAHELNNPLTSVLGFAEMLLAAASEDSPLLEDLETIAAEARRARDIVRNLLNFARQSKPLRQPGDVNQTLRQTLAVIRYHLEKSHVLIEEDYAPDLGFIPIDEGQLKQVVLNLITNAVRAMPEGGTLRLRTYQAGEEVALAVSDTGMGIAPEARERIFDPFFTTQPDGTGLGLSVSLGIVQEHSGRITVETEPGRGSTFTVWLPQSVDDEEP